MKQVSNAYKLSMKSLLREQSFVEITFSQVDTAAATDGNWVSNGAQSYSEFDTLDYGYDYQESYAALELNRWALDGNTVIVPSSGTMYDGFVSSHMSNAEGKFTTPAVLTRAFSNPHTFPGITLTFDTRYQEWPDTVTVDFYLNGAVLESLTLPVEGTELVINTKVASCDKIVLTMGNILPYRRPRLQQVLYGVQKKFGNDDIVSIKESHDVDPLSRRLPQETMQFVLLDYEHNYDPDNPKGIYAYLDKKSPIALRYGYMLPTGKVEWLKADKYVLNSKPKAAKNQATFTGTGLVGSLTGTFYKSKLGSKNFYDMAEEVLLDADLTLTAQGTHPWVIDPTLKQMFTTAALPIDSHMNCLQLIAHACRCRLFTDDDNIIHVVEDVNKPESVDPIRDIDAIDLELILADLEVVSNRLGRQQKAAKTGNKAAAAEAVWLADLAAWLEGGKPARSFDFDESDDAVKAARKELGLLSAKPVIYACNVGEDDLLGGLDENPYFPLVAARAKEENAQAIPICAKTEEDIAGSTQEEKIAFLQEMGIESTGLDKLIKASYELLGLISFLTDGKKECRAWTIRKGTKAPQAAGKIHSDFERGFIRAQVIAYKDLEDADFNYAAVKAKGLQRTEGKEYVVNDGDVIEFLFNV